MPDPQLEALRSNQLKKQFLYPDEVSNFYKITKHHLGLHSTDYWTPYLSVFARIGEYAPEEIFQSINEGDRLVRINAFRGTNFIIHTDNFPFLYQATAPYLIKRGYKVPPLRGFTTEKIESRINEILVMLSDKPLTLRELRKKNPHLSQETSWLVKLAMAKGILIRATAKHAKSNLTSYAPVKTWIPTIDLNLFTVEEAQETVIRKYIEVFGPVSLADIAWWLPVSKTTVHRHLKNLASEIQQINIAKTSCYMTQDDFEVASSTNPPNKPVINFLPYEDHFPKAYIDRSWYISDQNRKKIFPRSVKSFWPEKAKRIASTGPNVSGELRPSIWLNNTIVGRWELEKTKVRFRIAISMFQDLPPAVVTDIKDNKQRLESFVNDKLVPIS